MQIATRKSEAAAPDPAGHKPSAAAKRAKLSVLLVTRDDMLWPQICTYIGAGLILKQVDSIDELFSATPHGQPGIILWDTRNSGDSAAALSRLQLHSPRFVVVALGDAGNAHAWTDPVALGQVIAHVELPVPAEDFKAALDSAHEEVNARTALLGDGDSDAATLAAGARGKGGGAKGSAPRIPWIPAGAIGVAVAGAIAFLVVRRGDMPVRPAPAENPRLAVAEAVKPPLGATERPEEKVDLLIEKAQQAMLERHFIDPAEGSALTLYRNALLLDPKNGEAQQGLQRLAEILFTRVRSALDERKIDVALQALETARSISPGDNRLAALDERIASLRAEFGPAQIQAAINAQNFDRAAQLIDDAARNKALSSAKLGQLREELRRRHDEVDVANLLKLIDTRLSQDKVVGPRNDSAVYYLNQARAAGASAAAVQPQSLEINKRLAAILHAAIEQRRFADAERLVADARNDGVPVSMVASLQHDLTVARSSQAAAVPETPQNIDPRAVQAQVLEQARAALDGSQLGRAESLLQTATGLGASVELNPLKERLAQLKLAGAGAPQVAEASLTRIKGIEPDYPSDALRKDIEGWVDLSFVVSAEGKVAKVTVLDSSPAGVFDVAASKALSRAHYKPMLQDGKPIAVGSKLRIAFRLSK
ncbi:MAG: energy transducer TonB [Gammaproteobacteria bacterium]